MRKKLFLLFFSVLSPVWSAIAAETVPQPVGWVNDFAGVIPQEQESKLATVCEYVEQTTSTEITVVTVTTIAPLDEAAYARLLFDKWLPGKKGKDNGVLVLLAVNDRAWRIETGYGVEALLPDGLCGQIGRERMVPLFKSGAYGAGLQAGVEAIAGIILRAAGVPPREEAGPQPSRDLPPLVVILVFAGFILLAMLIERAARNGGNGYYPRRGRWTTGGFGGSGGFGGGFGSGGGGFGGFGGGSGGGGGAGGKF